MFTAIDYFSFREWWRIPLSDQIIWISLMKVTHNLRWWWLRIFFVNCRLRLCKRISFSFSLLTRIDKTLPISKCITMKSESLAFSIATPCWCCKFINISKKESNHTSVRVSDLSKNIQFEAMWYLVSRVWRVSVHRASLALSNLRKSLV